MAPFRGSDLHRSPAATALATALGWHWSLDLTRQSFRVRSRLQCQPNAVANAVAAGDLCRSDPRNGAIHVARASRGETGGQANGYLVVRRRSVGDVDRKAAV